MSLVLITHDLAVVARTCEIVNVMCAGRIVEVAPRRALFRWPRHPYTAALLLASVPRVDQPRSSRLPAMSGTTRDVIPWHEGCAFLPAARTACTSAAPALPHCSPTTPTTVGSCAASIRSRRGRRHDPARRSRPPGALSRQKRDSSERRVGAVRASTASTSASSEGRPSVWWATQGAARRPRPGRCCGWVERRPAGSASTDRTSRPSGARSCAVSGGACNWWSRTPTRARPTPERRVDRRGAAAGSRRAARRPRSPGPGAPRHGRFAGRIFASLPP